MLSKGSAPTLSLWRNILPFIASANVIGIAVGFAAKDTLSNLIAGVLLLIDFNTNIEKAKNLIIDVAKTADWILSNLAPKWWHGISANQPSIYNYGFGSPMHGGEWIRFPM